MQYDISSKAYGYFVNNIHADKIPILADVLGSFDELPPNADRRYFMIRREVPPVDACQRLIRAGDSFDGAAFRDDAEFTRYDVVDGDARGTELISVELR